MFGRRSKKDQSVSDVQSVRNDARLRAMYHQMARENAAAAIKELAMDVRQEYCHLCTQPAQCVWSAFSLDGQMCYCWACPACRRSRNAGPVNGTH